MEMWQINICFAVVVISLSDLFAAAPAIGPTPPHIVREFFQGEEALKGGASQNKSSETEDDVWFPVVEVAHAASDMDYPLPVKSKTKAPEKSKKSKTICEENGPGSKCSDQELSIDEIIKKIKAIVDNQNDVKGDELKKLRELVNKLSQKVHELQKSCGSKNGPIAEIERKHTVDRKIIKSDEHLKRGHSDGVKSASPIGKPAPTMKSFYDSVTVDVNFNGGMNMPMDDLRRIYPDGHWPDQDYVDTSRLNYPANAVQARTDSPEETNVFNLLEQRFESK